MPVRATNIWDLFKNAFVIGNGRWNCWNVLFKRL